MSWFRRYEFMVLPGRVTNNEKEGENTDGIAFDERKKRC
jgi:hypothetical protein